MQHSHLLLPESDFVAKVPLLHGPSPQFGLLTCCARFLPKQKPKSGLVRGPYKHFSSMKIPAIPQEAAKMPWSIDTTLSLISLLLTGTSSVFEIWYYVKYTYRRISFKGQPVEALRIAVTNSSPRFQHRTFDR